MKGTLPPGRLPRAKAIAERVDTLPLLPSVLLRVLHLDPESDGYFDELLKLASQEPNLAVRLLRYANSAASAPAKPIHSLQQAAMRLGTAECAHIVTALAVARVFVPRTKEQRMLWRHSVQVAYVARMIACRDTRAREAHEQAYVGGLLHDIGRFAMFEAATEDLQKVNESDWATPDELLASETALLGYDHAQLGALVCERWNLPSLLTEVVRLHHVAVLPPHAAGGALGEDLRVVRLADTIAVYVDLHPDLLDKAPTEIVATLAPVVARVELGKHALVLAHVAQHLQATMHEAGMAFDQLMAG
jgi:putative nucleotidyltransferase with HDIG domain